MIAEYSPHIEAAAQTLYEANADEATKRKCRARRDYYKQVNTREKMRHDLTDEISSLEHDNAKKQALLEEKDSTIAELKGYIRQLEQK